MSDKENLKHIYIAYAVKYFEDLFNLDESEKLKLKESLLISFKFNEELKKDEKEHSH